MKWTGLCEKLLVSIILKSFSKKFCTLIKVSKKIRLSEIKKYLINFEKDHGNEKEETENFKDKLVLDALKQDTSQLIVDLS